MALSDSFDNIREAFKVRNVENIYAKILSSNDNSKNQIYLGGDFRLLRNLPMENFEVLEGTSTKKKKSSEILRAGLPLYWLSSDGMRDAPAPQAKLIMYPQYPEVRFSGMLAGCPKDIAPCSLISSRIQGRILIFGTRKKEPTAIYGLVLEGSEPAAEEIRNLFSNGGFIEEYGPLRRFFNPNSAEAYLISQFEKIDFEHPVIPQKTNQEGSAVYQARNSAGYTLESLMGVQANSLPMPDIGCWELKAIETKNYPFPYLSKKVTLLTAEPDCGMYKDDLDLFRHKYASSASDTRQNFTGPWAVGSGLNKGLELFYDPFHFELALKPYADGELAAGWRMSGLLNHWKAKHEHAAFVTYKKENNGLVQFSPYVCLGKGATFELFLNGLTSGMIVCDPGVSFTKIGEKWKVHKRTQWRTCVKDLPWLYTSFDILNVRTRQSCGFDLNAGWRKIFGAMKSRE